MNTWEVLVVREHEGDWWYVTGPGLDEPILAVQRAPGTGEWLPVVSDGRGELIAIADSAGQLNSSYTGPEYDAGLWNSSGLTSHSRSFNPRRWATPGGIDTISTFRSRQYDPATGKWLQEDPTGVAGGVNLYQYNGNDPNSFSDPFGLCDPPTDPKGQTHVIQPDKGEIRPVSAANDLILAVVGGVVDAKLFAAEARIAAALGTAESAVGDVTVEVGSAREAETACNRFVGEGARDILETHGGRTGPAIGRESADQTRVYRFPALKKSGPNAGRTAANLVRKVGGDQVGNTHLIFPEGP
ncbi:MAG TPA: RHS repeat-associated core domain-containing protein [Gemmatimonadales bacterium]